MTQNNLNRIAASVGVVVIVALGTAQSAETPESILERVKKLAAKQQFAGVRRVMIWDPAGQTKTFDERILRKGNSLRIEYPDDSPFAGQVVVEANGKRQSYFVAKNEIRESRIRSIDGQLDFTSDRRRGPAKLVLTNGSKIADQNTKKIEVWSGDAKRQCMWIEPRRAIILKREMYDNEGKTVGGYEYRRIAFVTDIADSKFALPKDAKIIRPKDDLIRLAKELDMKAYTLSPDSGFTLMHTRGGDMNGAKVLRQIFDSGKIQVSLIQVRGGEHRDLSKREGRINVYPFNHNGTLLVLIGESDIDSLRRLASRIVLQQP